jgi:hypothetical protein
MDNFNYLLDIWTFLWTFYDNFHLRGHMDIFVDIFMDICMDMFMDIFMDKFMDIRSAAPWQRLCIKRTTIIIALLGLHHGGDDY